MWQSKTSSIDLGMILAFWIQNWKFLAFCLCLGISKWRNRNPTWEEESKAWCSQMNSVHIGQLFRWNPTGWKSIKQWAWRPQVRMQSKLCQHKCLQSFEQFWFSNSFMRGMWLVLQSWVFIAFQVRWICFFGNFWTRRWFWVEWE